MGRPPVAIAWGHVVLACRNAPFLLVAGQLIAPWPPASARRPWQTWQRHLVAEIVEQLSARRQALPVFAWVSVAGDITPMVTPPAQDWLNRRLHDGATVPLSPPAEANAA
jgi:hypothetical protein